MPELKDVIVGTRLLRQLLVAVHVRRRSENEIGVADARVVDDRVDRVGADSVAQDEEAVRVEGQFGNLEVGDHPHACGIVSVAVQAFLRT